MGRSALLVGEPIAIHSRSKRGLVNVAGDVHVLRLRVVAGVFIAGGETREIESGTRCGGVGDVGGSGADAACAKASEEGSTVVLMRYGHLEFGGLYGKVQEAEGTAGEVENKMKDD